MHNNSLTLKRICTSPLVVHLPSSKRSLFFWIIVLHSRSSHKGIILYIHSHVFYQIPPCCWAILYKTEWHSQYDQTLRIMFCTTWVPSTLLLGHCHCWERGCASFHHDWSDAEVRAAWLPAVPRTVCDFAVEWVLASYGSLPFLPTAKRRHRPFICCFWTACSDLVFTILS